MWRLTISYTAGAYAPATSSSSSRALLSAPAASAPLFGVRQILSSVPLFKRLVTPAVMSSVTPTCSLLGQQAEPACVQQSKCSHCFESKLGDIGLNADVHMVGRTVLPYLPQSLASSSLNLIQPPCPPTRPLHPFLSNPGPSLPHPTSTDQSLLCLQVLS